MQPIVAMPDSDRNYAAAALQVEHASVASPEAARLSLQTPRIAADYYEEGN
jgi:hypothetical protein